MDIDKLKDKKVAILGLGIEGVALARFLKDKVKKIALLDIVSKEKLLDRAEEESNSELKELLSQANKYEMNLGNSYLENLTDFEVIFRTPGIPYFNSEIQKAKESGVEVSSQIKLFFDLCPAKIVGITGTKGKGTTASLIESILKINCKRKVFVAGNIGKPAITLLDEIGKEDIVILELSSFQLQDLEKSPHIAVITNLSIDHLDYHRDREEYQDAKRAIYEYQSSHDHLVVNSKLNTEYYKGANSEVRVFSGFGEIGGEAHVSSGDNNKHTVYLKTDKGKEKIVSEDDVSLKGDHNLENIAAASLVASILGLGAKQIKEGVKKFKGLPHRLEFVAEVNGVSYFNDSFATNPEPTIAAIDAFKRDKILILGGSSKGANFEPLATKIVSNNVVAVILIGNEAKKIKKSLKDKHFSGQIINADSLREVIKKSKEISKENDVVVFSPACASFDMFKNYKDRGNKFRDAVLNER